MQEHRDRPLSALLSQILVAYTVEFDNEFERRMNESGYVGGRLSLVVWSNPIRFISENAMSVRDLTALSRAEPTRIRHVLGCLERWGFAHSMRTRTRAALTPGAQSALAFATSAAARAADAELSPAGQFGSPSRDSQQEKFGRPSLTRSNNAGGQDLAPEKSTATRIPAYHGRPNRIRIARGLVEVREMTKVFPAKVTPNTSHLSLPALLSRTLLIFALEFEPQSWLSAPTG
jgi:hypothetical protein